MRAVILIFLLLFASDVCASDFLINSFSTFGDGGGGDDCSGDLMLSVYFENDLDITVGGGCTDGSASTLTANSDMEFSTTQVYEGSYSAHRVGNYDRYDLTVSSNNIFNEADFKIEFRAYVVSYASGTSFFKVYNTGEAGSDYVTVEMFDSGTDLRMSLKYEGSDDSVITALIGNAKGRTTGEWFYVEVIGKQGTITGTNLQVKVCDSDGASNCETTTDDTDLVVFDNSPNVLVIGDVGANSGEFYIDSFKIYATSGL